MATTPLPPEYSQFLRSLDENRVRYLLVGAHAVGYHGYTRSTGDLDVWVEATAENAERLVQALNEFGFDMPDLTPGLFLEPDAIIQFGFPPLRIDLLTNIAGVTFGEAYASRVIDTIDGVTISVIDLESLKASKRAAGRHKDLADLEHLP